MSIHRYGIMVLLFLIAFSGAVTQEVSADWSVSENTADNSTQSAQSQATATVLTSLQDTISREEWYAIWPDFPAELFSILDPDGDGYINRDPSANVIPELADERRALFAALIRLDLDSDGVLSQAEMEWVFGNEAGYAVNALDSNDDKAITRSELYNGLAISIDGYLLLQPQDANGDGLVNILDIQLVINHALGFIDTYLPADINQDGIVDSSDIQLILNATLANG